VRWDRVLSVTVTAIAVAGAIALEASGPPESFLFRARLPLLVLALGMVWTAFRWRARTARRREPVPMATPALILTSAVGIAALTIKLLIAAPAYGNALIAASAAVCCLALGLALTGRAPGEAVSAVGVDAGGELRVEDEAPVRGELLP
jgi:peptidoglycan/LPS O-acetylase OafA/YrhL